jgi:TonB family protein
VTARAARTKMCWIGLPTGVKGMKVRLLVLLACVLAVATAAIGDVVAERRAFALVLTKDVARSRVKKVYVPDFTDGSGGRSVLGRFFAATFAEMLGKDAPPGLVVVSRVQVHRYLSKSGRTDQDLGRAEVLAKLVSDLGPEAILWGKVLVNQDMATIDLVMRDPSGKKLFQRSYEEKLDGGLQADFDASQLGSDFYYAGLDGVSPPKCVYCPIPPWPVGQGSRREGNVVLSILVTVEGKADQLRVVQSLDPVYDRATLEGVGSWRFWPAKDANGKSVPVRVPVQITFKRH